MSEKTRTIDIFYFIKYLKSKAVVIICAVIIFGGLVAVYDLKKQKSSKDISDRDLLKQVMVQNHDAFFFNQKKYTDAEKPAGVYNSSAKISVDFNYTDVEGLGTERLSFQELNNRFENDVCTIIKDGKLLNEVIKELELKSYEDMKDITPDDLQWLINRNFPGAHVMNIVVSDVRPDRAKLICDKVVEKLEKELETYDFVDKVRVISEGTLPENGSLSISTGSSDKSVSKKELVKYAAVGMALGFIFIVCVLFMLYAFTDRIFSEADIKSAGQKMAAGSYRKQVDYKRLAHSLELIKDSSNILLVSVDNKTDAKHDAEEIGKELKVLGSNKKIVGTNDFRNEVDALTKVKECDGVIYLVKYGKSRIKTLEEADEVLSRSAGSLGVIVR
ncbi:MAG: hypothetical protein K6C35_07110 [Eubacterium sp.]|nr:hypothetical protein [Eubacterium sp.]